jgi:hypothetical protein
MAVASLSVPRGADRRCLHAQAKARAAGRAASGAAADHDHDDAVAIAALMGGSPTNSPEAFPELPAPSSPTAAAARHPGARGSPPLQGQPAPPGSASPPVRGGWRAVATRGYASSELWAPLPARAQSSPASAAAAAAGPGPGPAAAAAPRWAHIAPEDPSLQRSLSDAAPAGRAAAAAPRTVFAEVTAAPAPSPAAASSGSASSGRGRKSKKGVPLFASAALPSYTQ